MNCQKKISTKSSADKELKWVMKPYVSASLINQNWVIIWIWYTTVIKHYVMITKNVLNFKPSIFQERDDRGQLELQLLNEKNLNKKLQEESTNIQMELKKFAEWFVNALERTSGTSQKMLSGPEN